MIVAMTMITTVDEFVDVMGGNESVARFFKVGESAISMWKARGSIPSWRMHRAMELARVNNLAVDPRLFIPAKKRRVA